MATQEANPASAPSAQVVGNLFVRQYYQILHHSPKEVHKFYQDSSSLSRPDTDGVMATVTTMQAINDKILSLNYGDYTAEIITADAQESYEKGVIVLVTGCLTGKDKLRRKFTQTFFLAPQEKGYYVLNDVFRYYEENVTVKSDSPSSDGIKENAPVAPLTPEPEVTHSLNHLTVDPATSFEEEDLNNGPEVCDPSDNEEGSVIEEEVVEPHPQVNELEIPPTVDSAPANQDDAPKKSYASIVKVTKTVSGPVYVAASSVNAAPASNDNHFLGSAKQTPAPDTSVPSGDHAHENSNIHEESEGHSIFVRNLPFDATAEQLEEQFKKFGPIKHDGIQVRSNKEGFCFGFVEFEQLGSVQSALKASPITIGNHQAVVEIKRTTTRVTSGGRGRYSSGRPGFRSESFRGQGSYGGRSYGRNEFRNQGEFSGRPRDSTGRNEEGYPRGNQNRAGRGARQGQGQGGINRSPVTA